MNNNDRPRFKIENGNIIKINPDGTTVSRPLTDDERRRLEEARLAARRPQQSEQPQQSQPSQPQSYPAQTYQPSQPSPQGQPQRRPQSQQPRPQQNYAQPQPNYTKQPQQRPRPQQPRREQTPADEAEARRADQRTLARSQMEAAEQLGVVKRSKNAAYHEREIARRQELRNSQQREKQRRRIKINAGAVAFAVLMAAVVGVSARQIGINYKELENKPDNPSYVNELDYSSLTETDSPSETSAETEPTPAKPQSAFESLSVVNSAVHEGNLILVNYAHQYVEPTGGVNLVSANNGRTGTDETGRLRVAYDNTNMEKTAFDALERLVVQMKKETGISELMITSGHRTLADQQEIYDSYLASYGEEYTKAYVATPGYSEHQTGLACDLTFYTDGGSVPIPDHEYGYWIGDNCMYEGFVRRYPENKAEITKISYEAWHFRYVGIPHAYAMTTLDFCLEEYVNYLKDYSAEAKLLHIREDRTVEDVEVSAVTAGEVEGGWLAYYCPMTEGDSTAVPVPTFGEYLLSGNNSDGYIVTVTLD